MKSLLRAAALLVLSASIASAQDLAAAKAAIKNAQDQLNAAAAALAPPTSHTTTLQPGANVQAALTAAACGDTILLTPGTYPGSVTMAKNCATAPITLSGAIGPVSAVARMVAGTVLPKMLPTAGAALTINITGNGYVVRQLDVAAVLFGTVVVTGQNVTIDQNWIHGASAGSFKRGIALNGANVRVTRNAITDFHAAGQDSQAVGGWDGPGPFTIDNNTLEAAGENVMFGGSDPSVPGLVPSNITITNNTITKPLAWRANPEGWNIKNLIELKNATHVTITHNVLENSWQQAQNGFALLLTVRNQDGTAPQSTVQDVAFTENVVRHAAGGVNILGLDDDSARKSVRMARVVLAGNLFYDIDQAKWNDSGSGEWGSGRVVQILGGPNGVELAHNTFVGSPRLNSALTIGQPGDQFLTAGLNVHDNVLPEGTYGVVGSATGIGVAGLQTFAPGYVWTNNVLTRGLGEDGKTPNDYDRLYPPTTTVSAFSAPPVDPVTFVLTAAYASTATTDGKPVGANIAALKAAIPSLDLSK